MIDTNTCSSAFDRAFDFGDPDPADLDRLATSLDYLMLFCCKPMVEAGDYVAIEPWASTTVGG